MFGGLVGVRISVGHLQGPREHTLLIRANCFPEWLCQFTYLPAL